MVLDAAACTPAVLRTRKYRALEAVDPEQKIPTLDMLSGECITEATDGHLTAVWPL